MKHGINKTNHSTTKPSKFFRHSMPDPNDSTTLTLSKNLLSLKKPNSSKMTTNQSRSRNLKSYSLMKANETVQYTIDANTIPTLQSRELSTSSGSKRLYQPTNSISFKERNLIRSIPQRELKFELPFNEYTLPQFENFTSLKKKESDNSIYRLMSDNFHKKIVEKKKTDRSYLTSAHKNMKKKRKIKYTLKDLMNKNPYHLVSKSVKFSPFLDNVYISPQLNALGGGSVTTRNVKRLKLLNQSKPMTVFDSISVHFNSNNSKNNKDLLSRLLSMLHEINIPSNFKNAIIFEAIKLLWQKNSLTIEKLIIFYKDYKWFLEKKEKISQKVFSEFLNLIKLEKSDSGFSERVFLIFDTQKTGYINIKDFFFLMKLTSKNSDFYDKISFISDILVDLRKGTDDVNIKDINSLFKIIISGDNHKKDSKKLIDIIKEKFNPENTTIFGIDDKYISKQDCFIFLENCDFIKIIIQKFEKEYQKSNIVYEDQLINAFKINMRNSKNYIINHEIGEYCQKYFDYFENKLEAIEKATIQKDKIKKILEDDECFSNICT